jgi:hypothetical protein
MKQKSKTRRSLLAWGVLALSTPGLTAIAHAQPSDAQIKKDVIGNNAKNVVSIKLSDKGGTKAWSSAHLQYFWERGVVAVKKAGIPEYPNATVEIGGLARYNIIGGGFKYREFKVMWNKYFGIPKPSLAEIEKLLRSDLPKLVGEHAYETEIVSDIKNLKLADDPKWEWHTPNSVSLNLVGYFNRLAGDNKVESLAQVYRVRLYRDKIKDSFKSFLPSREKTTVLDTKQYSDDEIKAMRTLGQLQQDKAADAQLAALPKVDVPKFATDLELFSYTHKMLREAARPELHAYLLQVLTPQHFEEDRWPSMTPHGQRVVEGILAEARDGKLTYAQQYCPDPALKHYQTGMVQYFNAILPLQALFSRMTAKLSGGKYVDGVRTGQEWKLDIVDLGTVSKPDHIEYLKSFTSPEKLCAGHDGKQTLSQVMAEKNGGAPLPGSAAALAQIPETVEWTKYEPENGRLSIAFPSEPTQESDTFKNDQTDGKRARTTWTAKHSSGTYKVAATVFPQKIGSTTARNLVIEMANGALKDSGMKLRKNTEYQIGSAGRIYNMSKGDAMLFYRAYVVDDVLYELTLSTTKDEHKTENERAFFDSFQPR